MLKKIILTLLSFALVLNLAAKEFTFFSYVEKGTPRYDLILDSIKKFEATHKGVKIKLDIASNEAYHTKLKILSVGRKLPDMMTIFAGSRTAYVTKKGLIADLRPFIDSNFKNQFVKSAYAGQDEQGHIYEIPRNITLTGVVYANRALLKKLKLKFPKTYKEWLKQVKTIQAAGLTPLAIGNKSPWVMQSIVLSAILGRTAGNKWLEKAAKKKVSFTEKPFVRALEIMNEMYKTGLLDKATPTWAYGKGADEFLSGRAVYTMDGSWIINNYIKNGTDEISKNIEMHSFPAIAGEKNPGSISGIPGTGVGIKNSLSKKDKKLLFEFVKLSAGVGLVQENIKIGTIPLLKNIKFPSDTHLLVKKLDPLVKKSKITYVFDGLMSPESINDIQNSIQEMFLGTKTPAQAAKSFQKQVDKE
jgi:raffinose/stachyose/melibiose transport system substrate-binding protein